MFASEHKANSQDPSNNAEGMGGMDFANMMNGIGNMDYNQMMQMMAANGMPGFNPMMGRSWSGIATSFLLTCFFQECLWV